MFRRNLVLATSFTVAWALAAACSEDGSPPRDGEEWLDDDDDNGENGEGDDGDDDDDGENGDDDDDNDDEDDNDDDDDDDDDADPEDDNDDGLPHFDIGEHETGDPGDERCELDFMFVIDNSSSMLDEQDNLAKSVPAFVETVTQTLDLETFHLGTMTTDDSPANVAECRHLGGFIVSRPSLLGIPEPCGPYADGYSFMTHNDDLEPRLQCAGRPGVFGDGDEKPMEAMMNALGDDLNAAGACNEGFHRDGSILVIVVITDEEDSGNGGSSSVGDPAAWYDAVIEQKADPGNVVVLSLVGVAEPNECEGVWDGNDNAEVNVRIREFTEMFEENGHIGDVCADNYGPFFETAVSVIGTACDNKPE